jgi:hypothetical protein
VTAPARFGTTAAGSESGFTRAGRQVTVPVLFLQQRDDQLFPRNDGLALFDLLGSTEKILHANPGGHLDIPRAEIDNAVRFLRRHLDSDQHAAAANAASAQLPESHARRIP